MRDRQVVKAKMLFKVWMSLSTGYDGSIIIEADSLDDAIRIADSLSVRYNAVIKAVDNIYHGSSKPFPSRNRRMTSGG